LSTRTSKPKDVPGGPPPAIQGMPSLTGLRAFAAAVVFTTHALSQFGPGTDPASNAVRFFLLPIGQAEVSFFFLLSGFVLMSSRRTNDTVGRFWRRRLFRVYPNHIVTWVIGLTLLLIAGQQVSVSAAIPSLLLVHDWYPTWDLNQVLAAGINPITWSLSAEVFLYLSFPLLALLLTRVSRRGLWPMAGTLVAIIMVIPLIAEFLPGEPLPGVDFSVLQFWFVYAAPPVRALEFLLGMVLARLVREQMWPEIKLWVAVTLRVAGYAVAGTIAMTTSKPHLFLMVALGIIPLAILVPTAATKDLHRQRSFLRNPRLVWLGQISFAFYLVHYLVLQYAFAPLAKAQQLNLAETIGLAAVFFVIVTFLSWLLFVCVERPIARQRWGGDPRSRKPSGVSPDAAPAEGSGPAEGTRP
jgi:peptidoglycan/LPS O-acetylase OafA/YrhL